MTGTTRSSEGLDHRRRRVLFRAWHRGTREVDLITGRFADAHVGTLTDVELAAFEQLLDVPEPELYAWVTGELPVPESHDSALFRRMRDFHRNGPPR
jgi:antitoxin CptB